MYTRRAVSQASPVIPDIGYLLAILVLAGMLVYGFSHLNGRLDDAREVNRAQGTVIVALEAELVTQGEVLKALQLLLANRVLAEVTNDAPLAPSIVGSTEACLAAIREYASGIDRNRVLSACP